jgi:hypothetical protein
LKKDTVFFRQAELLLRVLPSVNEEEVFALKGGTAINFFFRDLPRLSVDIDLTYLPVNDRKTALMEIGKALLRILERVQKTIPGVRTFSKKGREFDAVAGLLIRRGDATITLGQGDRRPDFTASPRSRSMSRTFPTCRRWYGRWSQIHPQIDSDHFLFSVG